jgi:hypothetical protein
MKRYPEHTKNDAYNWEPRRKYVRANVPQTMTISVKTKFQDCNDFRSCAVDRKLDCKREERKNVKKEAQEKWKIRGR